MAEQLGHKTALRLVAASEVDGGEDGAAGEDAEGPVLEEGHDGSVAMVDRQRERSAAVVIGLVHVHASLRDEPLDSEGEF